MSRPRIPLLRSYVLPCLLASLAFRVLVPPEAMMSGGDMLLRAAMCTTTPGKIENIEVPAAGGEVHCDECMAPPLGAPLAKVHIDSPPRANASTSVPVAAQLSDTPLVRAQSARAPPLA